MDYDSANLQRLGDSRKLVPRSKDYSVTEDSQGRPHTGSAKRRERQRTEKTKLGPSVVSEGAQRTGKKNAMEDCSRPSKTHLNGVLTGGGGGLMTL